MVFCNTCGRGNPRESLVCDRCGGQVDGSGVEHAPEHAADTGLGLVAGQVINGDYELIKALGQGGMGSVWLARDLRIERQVALKFLNSELLAHPMAGKRMKAEARALGQVKHPNVVKINTVFDYGEVPVLEIEYVEGGDLSAHMDRQAVAPAETIRITLAVLDGLQALHDAELIHRDIKPDNVLMDNGRTPKLTDLGVAHEVARSGATEQGAVLGTPAYMSPEQVRGADVDYRTDLYATGILLYELLTGDVPFIAESNDEVYRCHLEETADMSRLPDEVPKGLAAILRRALEKEPQARFESARAMRDELAMQLPSGEGGEPLSPEQLAEAIEDYEKAYGSFLSDDGVIDAKEERILDGMAARKALSVEEITALERKVKKRVNKDARAKQKSEREAAKSAEAKHQAMKERQAELKRQKQDLMSERAALARQKQEQAEAERQAVARKVEAPAKKQVKSAPPKRTDSGSPRASFITIPHVFVALLVLAGSAVLFVSYQCKTHIAGSTMTCTGRALFNSEAQGWVDGLAEAGMLENYRKKRELQGLEGLKARRNALSGRNDEIVARTQEFELPKDKQRKLMRKARKSENNKHEFWSGYRPKFKSEKALVKSLLKELTSLLGKRCKGACLEVSQQTWLKSLTLNWAVEGKSKTHAPWERRIYKTCFDALAIAPKMLSNMEIALDSLKQKLDAEQSKLKRAKMLLNTSSAKK